MRSRILTQFQTPLTAYLLYNLSVGKLESQIKKLLSDKTVDFENTVAVTLTCFKEPEQSVSLLNVF